MLLHGTITAVVVVGCRRVQLVGRSWYCGKALAVTKFETLWLVTTYSRSFAVEIPLSSSKRRSSPRQDFSTNSLMDVCCTNSNAACLFSTRIAMKVTKMLLRVRLLQFVACITSLVDVAHLTPDQYEVIIFMTTSDKSSVTSDLYPVQRSIRSVRRWEINCRGFYIAHRL